MHLDTDASLETIKQGRAALASDTEMEATPFNADAEENKDDCNKDAKQSQSEESDEFDYNVCLDPYKRR